MQKTLNIFAVSVIILLSCGCDIIRPTAYVSLFYLEYNEKRDGPDEVFENRILTVLNKFSKEMNFEYSGSRKYFDNVYSYSFYNREQRTPIYFTPAYCRIKIIGEECKTEYFMMIVKKMRERLNSESISYIEKEEREGFSSRQ